MTAAAIDVIVDGLTRLWPGFFFCCCSVTWPFDKSADKARGATGDLLATKLNDAVAAMLIGQKHDA